MNDQKFCLIAVIVEEYIQSVLGRTDGGNVDDDDVFFLNKKVKFKI